MHEYLTNDTEWYLVDDVCGPFWYWNKTPDGYEIVTDSGKLIVKGPTRHDCIRQLLERDAEETR